MEWSSLPPWLLLHWHYLILSTLITVSLVALAIRNKAAVSLWWTSTRHHFPFIGKIRRLSKDNNLTDGWFYSETQICDDYKTHYQHINKEPSFYTSCREYLDIAGEAARKPLSAPFIFFLFLILAIEAFGFGYTVSQFIDITASENTRTVMAWFVAIMCAIVLAFTTHKMGVELYRNQIINNIRELWNADKSPCDTLTPQAHIGAGAIENPADTESKPYIRRLNRLKMGPSHTSKFWTITTIILILLLAVAFTIIRLKAFEAAQANDLACGNPVSTMDFGQMYGETSEPTNDTSSPNEACTATEQGSIYTYLFLALIFCGLQGFSTWISRSYGFASEHGERCYRITHQFNNEREFTAHFEQKKRKVCNVAQQALHKLQNQMAKRLQHTNTNLESANALKNTSERTFLHALKIDDARFATHQKAEETELATPPVNDPRKAAMLERIKQANNKNIAMEDNDTRLIAEIEADLGRKLTNEEREAALNPPNLHQGV
ncbi:hypothetical protein ACP3V3_17010 [Vibrio sp. PNB22_3_1]